MQLETRTGEFYMSLPLRKSQRAAPVAWGNEGLREQA